MPKQEKMDIDAVLDRLDTVLALQYRSALEYTVLAGSQQGVQWRSLGELLWGFAQAELDDARRLVEKVVALGGRPSASPAAFAFDPDPEVGLATLLEHEAEALAAIHAVIPDTGQEPRSEALEHRIEHVIMRKQEQVDTLRRAIGRVDGDPVG